MALKILGVSNLIPIRVDYENEGKNFTLYAYVDYSTYKVTIPDSDQFSNTDEIEDEISKFLLESHQQNRVQLSDSLDVPDEAYKTLPMENPYMLGDFLNGDYVLKRVNRKGG